IPSITSTITTVRASSFSAMRCAVVAPTLPAPTTVILLTIISLESWRVVRESYPTCTRRAIGLSLQPVTARAAHRFSFEAADAPSASLTGRCEKKARVGDRCEAECEDRSRPHRTDTCADARRP